MCPATEMGAKDPGKTESDSAKTLVLRLKPGEEIFQAIEALLADEQVQAGVITSLVGSLKTAHLRFADAPEGTMLSGPFEIISCTGVVALSGSHIHIGIADGAGQCRGGHLLPGSLVYTTVELVVQNLSQEWCFERKPCPLSGYEELAAKRKQQQP
ncbi:MAG: DNA-binding protein [Candidatus Melainabacteria bacterium]|nr:DNA-binding protein [Candidatus Melainabacteria bacterium]